MEAQVGREVRDDLARIARFPDDIRDVLRGHDDATLSRRAAPSDWSATDVACHLRDVEEVVILRFHLMLATDDPHVFVVGAPPPDLAAWGFGDAVPFPLDPDRWRAERQYDRSDPGRALEAFARRRHEVVTLLTGLTPAQWERGCILPTGARRTFAEWIAAMAHHDGAHLEQLRETLPA